MATIIKKVNIPVNRAEGDLEVRVDVTDGVITDAWSTGTMYRGFEGMMSGRKPLDGLVITPRICGICSLTHLAAAASALDAIADITPPDNAIRLRNVSLMAEIIQSDLRQTLLMYMADFTNHQAYRHHFLFEEAVARYAPLKGTSVIDVIRETKRLIEVIAIIGGQWPHTSFMVPGGVTSIPDIPQLMQCRLIIDQFQNWYESRVLGCSIERWQAVSTEKELCQWLDERPEHHGSDVGFFLQFALKAGLDTLGKGTNHFISYGNLPFPQNTTAVGNNFPRQKDKEIDHDKGNGKRNPITNQQSETPQCQKLMAAGFAKGTLVAPVESEKIAEDLSFSWFEGDGAPAHPFDGETRPRASGNSGERYSWVKAPRYDGIAAETGPLAEMIVDGIPLFHDMIDRKGPNALIRQLARITRPARLLPVMRLWIEELITNCRAPFYTPYKKIPDGQGAGMIEAARGALGHWVKIENQKISQYQIITPTAWNASPRDAQMKRGPWEEALIGTAVASLDNPVEAGHVIRSFDPCMVCAVHALQK
jgi:Ni,Fe-hydrogenase I large subunit